MVWYQYHTTIPIHRTYIPYHSIPPTTLYVVIDYDNVRKNRLVSENRIESFRIYVMPFRMSPMSRLFISTDSSRLDLIRRLEDGISIVHYLRNVYISKVSPP